MAQGINKFYRNLILICGGGLVLALVIFLGIIPLIDNANKPAFLDILVPAGAKVEIDGREYHSAIYEMEPGAYTATVTLGNLAPEIVNFNLEKNVTTGLYLNWTESGGWRYFTPDELAHHRAIGQIMPLYLPLCGVPATRMNCDAVVVNYDRVPECQNQECLVINGRRPTLTNEVLTAVRNKLSENGYNLDDYKYVYAQNNER